MTCIANIDGGSRGNPGPAGAGVLIRNADGDALLEAGYFLGEMTNNQAEYHALLRALSFAVDAGIAELSIRSDSELLVRQLNGAYRVKSPQIIPLFNEASGLLRKLSRWRAEHVFRERNQEADALANRAMDEREDVILVKRSATPPGSAKQAAPVHKATAVAPTVRVVCRRAPHEGACAAHCALGTTWELATKTTEGICLEAAAPLFRAVASLRSADRSEETMQIDCEKAGCGARFELSATPHSSDKEPKPEKAPARRPRRRT